MGGPSNGGAYCLCLTSSMQLAEWSAMEEPERPLYIDAEDASHSNWTRYINHADAAWGAACNLQLHVSTEPAPLAWLTATRRIQPNEELCFDYGPRYGMPRSSYLQALRCAACGYACIVGVQ